jgi:hypothetical protein
MIVDGAGGATGDRADRGARPASGYRSDGRATRGADRYTPDSPANMMMAAVDSTVIAMGRAGIRCVSRGCRDKTCD